MFLCEDMDLLTNTKKAQTKTPDYITNIEVRLKNTRKTKNLQFTNKIFPIFVLFKRINFICRNGTILN